MLYALKKALAALTPSWLQPIMGLIWKLVAFITLILTYVIKFPVFTSSTWYYAAAAVPLWLLWFVALTQPNRVDEVMEKVTSGFEAAANRLWSWLWPPWTSIGKIIVIALLFYGQMWFVPAFALAFKTWNIGKAKKWTIGRLVLTFGVCNFLASEKLMGSKLGDTEVWYHQVPLGWLLSYGFVIAFLASWMLIWQTDEYKQNAKKVFRKHRKAQGWFLGSILGFFELLLEDFFPKKVEWKCAKCGHKNPIGEKGPGKVCVECGAKNPDADWPCPKCKTINETDNKACKECGTKNPNLNPDSPDPDPDDPPPPPKDSISCPHCGKPTLPTSRYCGHCKADKQGGPPANTKSEPEQLSLHNFDI